jgi:alanine-synthesizing transaminase
MPSPGLPELCEAVAAWYGRRFGVEIDPTREVAVTLGSKEGIAHLLLAALDVGEGVLVPTPSYPVHHLGAVIAGAAPTFYRVGPGLDPYVEIREAISRAATRPRLLIINFPHNPTTAVCDAATLARLVDLADAEGMRVLSDMAYADLCFEGYAAPSVLTVPGGRRAIEFSTLSKGRSMAGWRVGFCVGDPELCAALKGIKRYMDYGMFKPIQRGAIAALGDDTHATALAETYRSRRDALCAALGEAGWPVVPPKATMFVWSRLPDRVQAPSFEFARDLLLSTGVALAPGATFGAAGEGHVRFGLIEDEPRLREAASRIGDYLQHLP